MGGGEEDGSGVIIALAGQRSFGAAVLEALREDGHEIRQVFAPLGDVLDFKARQHGLDVQPALVAGSLDRDLDLIVCAHAHVFVSEKARNRTALGGIGYHPSLLPRHRGRDAVRWTTHMRDPIAGGSVYWLTNQMDGGPIAASDWLHVPPGWNHHDLWQALFPMGVRLLRQALRDLDDGRLVRVPQDEACATWEPSWDRPPVPRPDLPQLTAGVDRVADRFELITSRSAAA